VATAEEIRGWFAANPGASDAQIAAAMQANNVSSGEVAAAMGVDPGMVAQRYAAATAPAATPPPAAAAPVSPQDWQLGVSGGLLNARRAGQTDAQYYGAVALAANKYLGNPGTAAEAFDAMSKAGISVSDLLNAGISQQTIDAALTLPTNPVQLLTNTAALNSMASTLAQNPLMAAEIGRTGLETIYKNAREYVGALQQGGLTDAERNKLREAAAGQGWSYADIRAAGLDPMLLFGTPKPVVPPPQPPQPPVVVDRFPNTQTPYTPVNVYQPLPQQPDIYAAGQPALDVAFRESAPRTAIPGMPGSYEYTPAAKLRPATGAGYTFTPPSVTSRPRSLLSPTLLSYISPSQQFAQSRAAQDQALLGAFRRSGLPQNASNFYSWRNRLRSGEFGAGSAFDPAAFQSAFGSWAATQAPGTPAQGTVPVGDVTGYSDIAGRIQPIDLRTVPTFAEGGEASARELLDRLKKPEGAEAESLGAFEQIQAAERAARLRGAGTPLERYTYETLGLEPGLDRAAFLPYSGEFSGDLSTLDFAMPGVVYEAAKALMTPGAVASGVPVSYEDVANLAGNVMGGGYAGSTPIDGAVAGMAIKQKGGNWLAGEIERAVAPLKARTIAGETPAQRIPRHEQLLLDPSLNTDQLDRVRYLLGVTRSEAATDDWIDKALSKYIRNEMATPEDPVRIQADAWAATKADLLAKKDAQIAKATADMEKARAERGFTPEMMTRSQAQIRELQKERDLLAAQTGLHMPLNATGDWLPPMNERKRIEVGMPPTPMGVSPEARFWEEVTDNAIDPTPASFYKQGGGRASIFANNPWLQQVPNEALVNSIPFSSSEALGFGHLIDEMRNALNPESGLPRELLINPKDLPKLTVPQMVERVSKINAWRAVQKAEADAARAANAATFPYRTYETIPGTNQPNERGLRWVELRTPEDGSSDALKDALKYEGEMLQHCVGGYCPEVEAGQSRIFSLRDARGQPYTTIEVTPPRPSFEQAKKYLDRDEPDLDENEKIAALFEAGYLDEEGNVLPDEPSRIKQIKSTRNRAPAEEYLPFVQDFVRSGQWSTVGDLKNTGLERASDIYDAKELSMLRSQGREVPDYLTKAEIAEFDKLVRKNTPGMAKGGPVQGYANGGEVTTPQTESRSMLERLSRFTSLDTPQDMSLGETVADIGMGFLPVVGTAQGMRDFERARREDDTLGMVLGAAGMVPVAGGAVRAARKAAKAAKEIPGAARQMLDEVSPLVMYRGLTREIDPTKTRGVNKLIFMSPDPQVASGYALNNKLFGLPSEDMQTTDWAERQLSNAREFDPEAAPNVFKLNIRPQNTFDFQNEAHIAQLEKDLPKILARATPSREPYTRREIKDTIEGIKKGRWQYIEDVAQNTDFFEKAGFDSLYVDEGGVKNLGVFDPTLIKSAIGNEGTFDPTSPVITKADGGEVTAPQTESRRLLDQVEAGNQGLRNLPLERMNARRARAGMDPYAPARSAASMLENIIRGGAAIPGTVGRYAERVVGSEDPLAKLGGDITGVGGAMLQGLKEDPLGFAADVAPIIGEIRSAADVDKYSALANEAAAAGNLALAKVYQEIVAMSAAGAVPLAGMATRVGGRVGKRGLIDAAERAAKEAAEQAPTEARQMLDEVPNPQEMPTDAVRMQKRDSGIMGLPISPQGTLGDALTQLNITPQRMDEWRSSREGMRQEKVPQVQQAAEALREGKISTEEYQRTVQQYQPIKPLAAVQKMPTVEEIAMALGKNAEKSPGIVGVNVDIPDGTRVASRLDIPAYEKYDTWVVSLHDGNKTGGNAIGYGQAAVINNVDFMSSAKAALNIATGKSAKGTIARMYGSWENRDPQAVAQQARDILSGKAPDAADWAEVGMNPFRHSYFYRKSDGMPVASAEQVIQVGPLVLAKKPVTRPVESPEHQINTPEGPRYFKKGGNVERVTNDNRKYF